MSVRPRRKPLSKQTRLASTLLRLGDVSYAHGIKMHEDQIVSLYEWDHNRPHAHKDVDLSHLGIPDVDHFSNYTPMLISEHRAKTRQDIKQIAKGNRLRKKLLRLRGRQDRLSVTVTPAVLGPQPTEDEDDRRGGLVEKTKRKLRSRGFDKTLTRKFSGQVVKRRGGKNVKTWP